MHGKKYSDEEILEWGLTRILNGEEVSLRSIRRQFGVGFDRAQKLHRQILQHAQEPQRFLAETNVSPNYAVERMLVNRWGSPENQQQQIKVWLRPREDLSWLKERLMEAPRVEPLPAPEDGEALAVLSIMDLHVGMLAWEKEVGQNYDSSIALERAKRAASYLLDRLPSNVKTIIVPIGNDIFHSDNHVGETTAGTRLDVDSRWQRSFQETAAALISGPLSWAAERAEVKVVIVQGNHDYQRSFYLGEVLRWYFQGRGLPVFVDNRPLLRKYIHWGRILLGFTHGAWIKVKDLPMIMAVEAPEYWGRSTWREWIIGHFHAKREMVYGQLIDANGVRVRVLPSLASEDAWHYQSGFVGRHPEATLTVYESERGPIAEFFYRP